MNHFKNKISAIPAKNKMSAVESSLQEIKMCVVETKNRMCAVEGDNSPNLCARLRYQNYPHHPKPKSKTEIGFLFQSMFTPSECEQEAGQTATPMQANMIENKRSTPCISKARAINLYLI